MPHPLDPYPDPAALDAERDALVARTGARASVYGESVEGRPLRAIVVSRAAADAPHLLVNANLHGPEWIGNRVAMGFLAALADDPRGRALAERAHLHVLPCLNPDGHARTFEQAGAGRMAEMRGNARGVDLNRNFPLPYGHAPSRWRAAGSPRPGDATYRGPYPLSEPEASAVEGYLRQHPFHASASLHSFLGTLMIPLVFTRAEQRGYAALGRAFRAGQPRGAYRTVMFPRLDVFTGELEDHQHHVHRTWAVCVEAFPLWRSCRQHLRAPSVFWRSNPRDPAPIVEDVVGGLFGYFDAALAMPRPRPAAARDCPA